MVGDLAGDGQRAHLEAVRDVTVEQSTWQQIANVGTLRLVADGGDLTFSLVEN